MSELAKRLREWAEMLRKDGYADCPADLLAVAELVERAEWRPIDLSKLDGETAVLCGTWLSLRKGEKTWAVSAQR